MTKIKPPYSDGRVELNGGADRVRDAQISWNTLFQDVPSGLGRFLSPPNVFSSFLHDFCVEYLRRTNFSRATRFLVDLPAHGGAVGFFISGFVATALSKILIEFS